MLLWGNRETMTKKLGGWGSDGLYLHRFQSVELIHAVTSQLEAIDLTATVLDNNQA